MGVQKTTMIVEAVKENAKDVQGAVPVVVMDPASMVPTKVKWLYSSIVSKIHYI